MDNEPESITQTRVRLYREALAQLRAENELKEQDAELAKEPDVELANEAEAESAKEPEGPGSDRAHSTAREGSDKA
jgi:hypothetical protein